MLRVFVDSGSSIKQDEKEKYGVEILPLKLSMGGIEYEDGVDISIEKFYQKLIVDGIFPKTSLPSLGDAELRVNAYTEAGDDVIILTISSGISGTYNALRTLFADNKKVRVIDTKTAVGGIRLLVDEVNKYRDRSVDFIEKKVTKLIPRIRVVAVPETLEYLCKGGRLSLTAMVAGTILKIKPLISLDSTSGKVKIMSKAFGLKRAMTAVADSLRQLDCDENYGIIPSYTFCKENLDVLVSVTNDKYKPQMQAYDNLDPAIACHWGPNAFGYIFVSKATAMQLEQ